MLASFNDQTEVVEVLLEAKADVNAKANVRRPLLPLPYPLPPVLFVLFASHCWAPGVLYGPFVGGWVVCMFCLPCSLLPYTTLPYLTLPYPTLPYPTLPYPTLMSVRSLICSVFVIGWLANPYVCQLQWSYRNSEAPTGCRCGCKRKNQGASFSFFLFKTDVLLVCVFVCL